MCVGERLSVGTITQGRVAAELPRAHLKRTIDLTKVRVRSHFKYTTLLSIHGCCCTVNSANVRPPPGHARQFLVCRWGQQAKMCDGCIYLYISAREVVFTILYSPDPQRRATTHCLPRQCWLPKCVHILLRVVHSVRWRVFEHSFSESGHSLSRSLSTLKLQLTN